MNDLLVKAVPALEWLGLFPVVNEEGYVSVHYGSGQFDRTYPEPNEYLESVELKGIDECPDHENAQARDLILDALEAKGYSPVLGLAASGKPGRYGCSAWEIGCPVPAVAGFGHTRTEAVLKAVIAVHREATP